MADAAHLPARRQLSGGPETGLIARPSARGTDLTAVNGDYSQTAGVTNVLAGAHLNLLTTSRAVALAGGVLEGTGTIGGGVTNIGGTVRPGGAGTGKGLAPRDVRNRA